MTELDDVLAVARDRGFLGPGPVAAHIAHALGFADAAVTGRGVPPTRVVDLGSGGGVPGLVLALRWPNTEFVLVDGSERRTAFLEESVRVLGLAARVRVVRARAEDYGRAHRQAADLVVARGFGPPAVTAECGAPLLEPGGRLVVSEPPEEDGARWPRAGLDELGLIPVQPASVSTPRFAVMTQVSACPERYPRRVGVPSKRPLW